MGASVQNYISRFFSRAVLRQNMHNILLQSGHFETTERLGFPPRA